MQCLQDDTVDIHVVTGNLLFQIYVMVLAEVDCNVQCHPRESSFECGFEEGLLSRLVSTVPESHSSSLLQSSLVDFVQSASFDLNIVSESELWVEGRSDGTKTGSYGKNLKERHILGCKLKSVEDEQKSRNEQHASIKYFLTSRLPLEAVADVVKHPSPILLPAGSVLHINHLHFLDI